MLSYLTTIMDKYTQSSPKYKDILKARNLKVEITYRNIDRLLQEYGSSNSK